MWEKYGRFCGRFTWFKPAKRLAKASPADFGKLMAFLTVSNLVTVALRKQVEKTLLKSIDTSVDKLFRFELDDEEDIEFDLNKVVS